MEIICCLLPAMPSANSREGRAWSPMEGNEMLFSWVDVWIGELDMPFYTISARYRFFSISARR